MSLVEAFRFPFYRIFFSVVVGIIALEGFILSYNYNEDRKITDGVLIRIIEPDSPQELPLSGQVEIPFFIKTFYYNGTQSANFDVDFFSLTNLEKTDKSYFLKETIPKIKFTGGFVIKDDPFLILENRPDIVIGDHWLFLKFKNWNIIALTIYLLIAGIVGEFLCTLGDLLIGICCFGFNPCSCDDELEYCNPSYFYSSKKNDNKSNNKSDSEEQEKDNKGEINPKKFNSGKQIESNDVKSDNNKIVKISGILKNNSMKVEFSELHFSLSRVYAGLFLSMLAIMIISYFPSSLIIVATLIIIILILIKCFAHDHEINRISLLILYSLLGILIILIKVAIVILVIFIIVCSQSKNRLPMIFILPHLTLTFIFILLSITFRTQANRIIIQRAQEEQQNQTEIRS